MGFSLIPTKYGNLPGREPLRHEVRVQMVHKVMTIRVARDIGESLGWQPGDRFDILFGDGRDAGSFVLRRSQNGVLVYPKQSKAGGNAALVFSTQRLPVWLPPVSRPTATVQHRFAEGGLLATLPTTWLNAGGGAALAAHPTAGQTTGQAR